MSEVAWSCTYCHQEADRARARLDIHDRLICENCQDDDSHTRCDICLRYNEKTKNLNYLYHTGEHVCAACEISHCATCMGCEELYQRDTQEIAITVPDGRCICARCEKDADEIPDDHEVDEDDFVWHVRAARAEAERIAQWVALLAAGQMPLPGLEDLAYRPTIAT